MFKRQNPDEAAINANFELFRKSVNNLGMVSNKLSITTIFGHKHSHALNFFFAELLVHI